MEISEDLKNMVKISMVSNPIVTAAESNFIWFVKSWGQIRITLDFTPFDFIMRFIAALNEVPNKRGPISL